MCLTGKATDTDVPSNDTIIASTSIGVKASQNLTSGRNSWSESCPTIALSASITPPPEDWIALGGGRTLESELDMADVCTNRCFAVREKLTS